VKNKIHFCHVFSGCLENSLRMRKTFPNVLLRVVSGGGREKLFPKRKKTHRGGAANNFQEEKARRAAQERKTKPFFVAKKPHFGIND